MDYFDRDASLSMLTPAEEMTYIAIQNILCDERAGWVSSTYRAHGIQETIYDTILVKLKDRIPILEKEVRVQEQLIESLQKKGTDAALTNARSNFVELLDELDRCKKSLESYTLAWFIETHRLNILHNISYAYKISKDKDSLVASTTKLMEFVASNQISNKEFASLWRDN
jgi:hypothetical protein